MARQLSTSTLHKPEAFVLERVCSMAPSGMEACCNFALGGQEVQPKSGVTTPLIFLVYPHKHPVVLPILGGLRPASSRPTRLRPKKSMDGFHVQFLSREERRVLLGKKRQQLTN